jgi:peptidoglycan/LPS O-acetylase OafA/YrhL
MTVSIFFIRYYTDIELPLIIYAGNFATWIMFYVLGLRLGASMRINVSNKLLMNLIVASYALSCVESYILIGMFHQSGDAVTAVKASSFLYSFFVIVFLFKNHDFISLNLLRNIGKASFGIYLIHMFALVAVGHLLSRLPPPFQKIAPTYQFVQIGMVTLLCFFCISTFNKVFSFRQSQLIGFK